MAAVRPNRDTRNESALCNRINLMHCTMERSAPKAHKLATPRLKKKYSVPRYAAYVSLHGGKSLFDPDENTTDKYGLEHPSVLYPITSLRSLLGLNGAACLDSLMTGMAVDALPTWVHRSRSGHFTAHGGPGAEEAR